MLGSVLLSNGCPALPQLLLLCDPLAGFLVVSCAHRLCQPQYMTTSQALLTPSPACVLTLELWLLEQGRLSDIDYTVLFYFNQTRSPGYLRSHLSAHCSRLCHCSSLPQPSLCVPATGAT